MVQAHVVHGSRLTLVVDVVIRPDLGFRRSPLASLRTDGLTEDEGQVADDLTDAWLVFSELPVEHEDDRSEFLYHVHMLQGMLTMRIARREYPEGWPTHGPE